MQAVFLKELNHYFTSFTGYIYLSIQLLFCSLIFTSGNLLSQNSDIKSFFSSVFGILVFLIPLLTMRQFSEEKKMKTHQLLFTLPLSTEGIVIGKYLATLTVAAIGLSFTLIVPFILALYGSFQPFVTLGNYTGILLLLSAVISLGLFVSSLNENQVISAIVSYAVILFLWLMDSLAPLLFGGKMTLSINTFSLRQNYLEFTFGIFNPSAVIFYLLFSLLFLFLTVTRIDSRRQ